MTVYVPSQLQTHFINKIKISRKRETFSEKRKRNKRILTSKATHTRRTRSRVKHKTRAETLNVYKKRHSTSSSNRLTSSMH